METAAARSDAVPAAVGIAGLSKSFGPHLVLDAVDLEVAPGEVVALLGPSGCGKTTLLRSVAGLERPDAGSVRVHGELLSGGTTWVPPERRQIGMVFQDWALFPHMTVAANVAYGLPRRAGGDRVARALAMVGLDGMGDRLPGTLSGGQQQRVALARALAPEPGVLLLDEPFSNLDTALRVQVRAEVRRLLTSLGVSAVFVTHDQTEAFVLGDRVAVMHGGRIAQIGSPADLYERPVTPWVAGFVGEANLLAGEASGPSASTPCGPVALRAPASGAVSVLARPEDLRLATGTGGRVAVVEYHGHDTVYLVDLDGGVAVRVREAAAPRWSAGDIVAVTHAGAPALAWPTPTP
jgi:iron(III) transport system ATP-binding protein